MKPLKIKLLLFALVCSLFTSCSSEEDGIYFDEMNEVNEYSTMENENYSHFEISIEQNLIVRNYSSQMFIKNKNYVV